MSHPNYLEANFRSQVIERYYNFRKGKFNLSVLSAQRTDQASKNLIQRILRMDGEQDEEKDFNLAHWSKVKVIDKNPVVVCIV